MGKSHRNEILPFHLIVCSIFSDKTVQKETELTTYSGNCCETPKPPLMQETVRFVGSTNRGN